MCRAVFVGTNVKERFEGSSAFGFGAEVEGSDEDGGFEGGRAGGDVVEKDVHGLTEDEILDGLDDLFDFVFGVEEAAGPSHVPGFRHGVGLHHGGSDDAEVGACSSERPPEIRVLLRADGECAAIGEDNVHGEGVVDTEAIEAHQVAVASTYQRTHVSHTVAVACNDLSIVGVRCVNDFLDQGAALSECLCPLGIERSLIQTS